ncbi:hypothetical protein LXA47_01950 [Massilia sp. P8910]|uniref:hypothetical protein n=1 Tax=Massilia antarctica TaxID=2765360 RepID=UPI001E2B8817|nr:hypothetical protein [Massilia antarctica]MCE3602376.1 hypothetical protein [Massilia antarctica]
MLSKSIFPTGVQVVREGLIVLGGVLLAAFVLSRFPGLRDWVTAQSIVVKDSKNNVLY